MPADMPPSPFPWAPVVSTLVMLVFAVAAFAAGRRSKE